MKTLKKIITDEYFFKVYMYSPSLYKSKYSKEYRCVFVYVYVYMYFKTLPKIKYLKIYLIENI